MPWCLGDPLAGVVRVYRKGFVKALIRDVGARSVANIGLVNCGVKFRENVARLLRRVQGSWLSLELAVPECQ